MKTIWKGALIGGAVGLGAVAYRSYKRDEGLEDAVKKAAKVSATSAVIGAAVAVLLEAKLTADQPKKKSRKRKSSSFRRAMRWTEIIAAATPIFQAMTDLTGGMAGESWLSKRTSKYTKYTSRFMKKKPNSDSIIVGGPLGKVRFATMNMNSAIRNRANAARSRVVRNPFKTHNGRNQ